jgi:hypothetical protein
MVRGEYPVSKPQIKECLRTITLNSEAILDYMKSANIMANIHTARLFNNTIKSCEFIL